jgi:hypothetical protein
VYSLKIAKSATERDAGWGLRDFLGQGSGDI